MATTATPPSRTIQLALRRCWRVVGQVQGVGFRPFIYRLATEHHLLGFVLNDAHGVHIEAQGELQNLDAFGQAIIAQCPPLARIDRIEARDVPPRTDEVRFAIRRSRSAESADAEVTVDSAVCPDCLREMRNPTDRRFGHGLINCTNCGPRFSIIRRVPYDRPNTTMAGFAMCPQCAAEYADPMDRRFHAQPTACPSCGPKVQLASPAGEPIHSEPIATAAAMLRDGKVLAIKGLGGFHLAVRADCEEAVGRLRKLKNRDHKPFALMCRDLAAARNLVELSDSAERIMLSSAAPIVLAARRTGANIAAAVAEQSHRLGVMLPYTPIQHLIFEAAEDLNVLVMTSANISDEPLVVDNNEAVSRLGGMCDAILWHDRPIERPVDDSVLLDLADEQPLPIRRARGFVPAPLQLPQSNQSPGLCVGGELKNTVAVVRHGSAILSQHLGDLTHIKAYENFRQTIRDMCELFSVAPQWIAHDLHPMYLSTQAAQELARSLNVPLVGVQHHHAHAASVMAENGVSGRVLAVVCDGVGYGTDGTMWGGELLLADVIEYQRLARLTPMRLPGGDAAAKDARRCALSLLHQAFGEECSNLPIARRMFEQESELSFLAGMLQRDVGCALSSGAGRVFDGVSALLGVCLQNSFEAQAAMALESAAAGCGDVRWDEEYFAVADEAIDLSPLIRRLVDGAMGGESVQVLAAGFHDQFARAWGELVVKQAERHGTEAVALSGGVFCNERLTRLLSQLLRQRGLRVLRHRLVPANDGGLAYGQAAIAAARFREGSSYKAGV